MNRAIDVPDAKTTIAQPRWRFAPLAAVLAVFACGAAAEDPGQAADRDLAVKLSGYVDCINRHGNWTLGSRDRYYSWLKSPAKGPTGSERVVYGVYPLYDPADCLKKIEAAAELAPDLPELEAVAADWGRALSQAEAVVAEAHDYYQLENYKDDRMQAGKALHPRLVAAFDAFAAANDGFYAAVAAQQDALAERRLQRLAQDPALRGPYLVALVKDRAKRILDSTEGIGRDGFDRDRFAGAVGEYEKAWRELDAWRDANPGDPVAAVRSSMFVDAGFELLKAAKAVQRRERDGFRFSSGERMLIEGGSPEMIEGHPANMIEDYNDFIEAGNR